MVMRDKVNLPVINFHIVSIFPQIIEAYTQASIIKKAQEQELVKVKAYNLRDWTTDKHKTVDDKPFGGGPGMIMKVGPIYRAIQDIKKGIEKEQNKAREANILTLLTALGGLDFNQLEALKWLGVKVDQQAKEETKWDLKPEESLFSINPKYNHIIIICGRYEGVDARVREFVDMEINIGNYILTGGEIAALVIIDALTRLVPGVLSNSFSPLEETEFMENKEKDTISKKVEYPQYTRPENFAYQDQDDQEQILSVPAVLLTGDHKKIAQWRASLIDS